MSQQPDPPDSTSPDLAWVWEGYCRFWDQALAGAVPWRQVERYAAEWGLPPGLKPIRGGDVFGDIADLARNVRDVVSRIVNTIGDAVWNVVWVLPRFLSDFWNRLSYVGDFLGDRLRWLVTTVWDGVSWVANTLQNRLSYVGDFLGDRLRWLVDTTWSGLSWLATNVWNGASWAANRVWDGIAWAGTTLYNGVTWAGQKAWDGITWAANRVWDGLSYVGGKVWDGATWVATKVWDGLSWLGTHLYDGVLWAANRVWDGLAWAATHVWDGLGPAFTWVWDNFFREVPGALDAMKGTVWGILDAARGGSDWTYFEFKDIGPRSPVMQHIFNAFAFLMLFVTVPSQLATVFSMDIIQEAAASRAAALHTKNELRDGLRRGFVSRDQVSENLTRYGFSPAKVDTIVKLWDELPTPTDLIRFGVREVFTPEIAESFGQFENFPPGFGAWMQQLGFSDFWAKNYWAAHWDLPSPQQGFEMYHRGIIDRAKLELLLRALDVMPFWRDQMIQIAFNPITRIDLRRMFRAGVLSEAQVLRGYLDLGYAPENAELITEWVKRDAVGVSKELPAAAILKAYRKRLFSRDQATAALEDLDLSLEAVDVLLDLEDLAIEDERADLLEDLAKKDYKAGVITRDQAAAQLADLGVPPERITLLLDFWTVEKAPRTVTLSAGQIQRAFHEGLIGEGLARQRLEALGFNEADVDLLLRLATPEAAAVEPRELSLAQLQAATRRGFLATFLNVREWLDDVVELGIGTPADITALTDTLRGRGYGESDANVLTALTFPAPEVAAPPRPRTLTAAQLLRAFKGGLIAAGEVVDRLREQGYSDRDIAILLAENEPRGA